MAYVQQGKYEEAVELYRRSIELLADNKEKAISWSQLGNVYRHLKDYSKAVNAYEQADVLDPQGAGNRAVPDQLLYVAPHASTPAADTVTEEAGLEPEADEAWIFASGPDPEPDSTIDDSTASWTPSDPTQVQQNISESPETGSLTTWEKPQVEEDDLDLYAPAEEETEVYIPDADSEDLTKWLPLPEEEPRDEVSALESLDSLEEPEEIQEQHAEPDVNHSTYYEDIKAVSLAPSRDDSRSRRRAERVEARVEPKPRMQQTEVEVQQPSSRAFVLVTDEQEDEALRHSFASQGETLPQAQGKAQLGPVEAEPEGLSAEKEAEEIAELEAEIAKFSRVVEINPRNAFAWDALGTVYKSAGRYKDAILAYQQAISIDSSKAVYHHHLGLVYACEGRDEDAMSAFQKVIEIDPDYSLAHATLGGYYRKLGLEELAQKHIGKAMKNIFDSENEYNRACLEAICGNADQALELLRVALKNKQTYVDWILRDPDLDFIRQDPRFKQLVSDYTR